MDVEWVSDSSERRSLLVMAPLINSDLYLTPHALDNPSPFVKLFEYLVEFCEIGPIILRSYFWIYLT